MSEAMAREEHRRLAARLVWEGDLGGAAIAARCGICRRTLNYWKRCRDFRALVAAERRAWRRRTGLWAGATRAESEGAEFARSHWGIRPGASLHTHTD